MTASEDEERGRHGRGTAIDDWPRGFDEASWWPLVTVLGIVGSAVGVGTYFVGRSVPLSVNPRAGIAVFLVGVLVAGGGVTGWVYQGFIDQYREKRTDSHRNRYLWGTLLYVPVEFAVFGGGLLYFAFVYFLSWPPGELPPVFTTLIWIMTALLLASSFTLYFAGRELRKGNERRFLGLLAATPVLGVLFLVGKAANYYRLVVGEGVTIESGIYWSAFFGLDGLHGLLVTAGVALLLVVLARALAGHYSPDRHLSLTTAAMYWWMLEAVWILLLVELYGTAAICRATGPC